LCSCIAILQSLGIECVNFKTQLSVTHYLKIECVVLNCFGKTTD